VNESTGPGLDVFISYAHEDANAVHAMLYERLRRCRTAEGRPPRVFLDTDPRSLEPGQPFVSAIMEAIGDCRSFLPVLSNAFLASRACRAELRFAVNHGWLRDWPRVIPLQLGRIDPASLPTEVAHIQYLPMEGPDWFRELCRQLELVEELPLHRLRFLTRPADVVAGAVLAPIEVAAGPGGDPPASGPATVSVIAEAGRLEGTLTQPVVGGVAVFDDLSFATAEPATRLVATTGGRATALSEPFAVASTRAARPVSGLARARRLGPPGDVRFLTEDRLLVLRTDRLELTDSTGEVLAKARLDGPVRFLRRLGQTAVVGTWSGRVLVATADGALSTWDLARREGFGVPGDAAIGQRDVEVGGWDGTVHRIGLLDGGPPEPVLDDRAGVQALEVAAGRRYVHGMDGWLRAWERGRVVAARELEPVVRLLKAVDQWLLVVGASTLYRLSLDLDEVHPESLQSEVAGVLGDGDLLVAVCSNGEGFRVDEQLAMLDAFRAAPGARPWSTDQSGDRCTLVDAAGSRSLVDGVEVVAGQGHDPLAVSPSGELLAVGDAAGIAVVPASAFTGSARP
jgi:hypothetical protein